MIKKILEYFIAILGVTSQILFILILITNAIFNYI